MKKSLIIDFRCFLDKYKEVIRSFISLLADKQMVAKNSCDTLQKAESDNKLLNTSLKEAFNKESAFQNYVNDTQDKNRLEETNCKKSYEDYFEEIKLVGNITDNNSKHCDEYILSMDKKRDKFNEHTTFNQEKLKSLEENKNKYLEQIFNVKQNMQELTDLYKQYK